ncbi:MAG: hypothetical protein ACK4N5_16165, partial [Myxococcales bacterium]
LAVLGSAAQLVLGTDGQAADVRQDQLLEIVAPSSGRSGRSESTPGPEPIRTLAAALFDAPAVSGEYRRLSPGNLADLALLDLRPLLDETEHAGFELQLLAAPVAWTFVGGQVIVREGELLTADEEQAWSRARAHSRRIREAMGAA